MSTKKVLLVVLLWIACHDLGNQSVLERKRLGFAPFTPSIIIHWKHSIHHRSLNIILFWWRNRFCFVVSVPFLEVLININNFIPSFFRTNIDISPLREFYLILISFLYDLLIMYMLCKIFVFSSYSLYNTGRTSHQNGKYPIINPFG